MGSILCPHTTQISCIYIDLNYFYYLMSQVHEGAFLCQVVRMTDIKTYRDGLINDLKQILKVSSTTNDDGNPYIRKCIDEIDGLSNPESIKKYVQELKNARAFKPEGKDMFGQPSTKIPSYFEKQVMGAVGKFEQGVASLESAKRPRAVAFLQTTKQESTKPNVAPEPAPTTWKPAKPTGGKNPH